MAFTKALCYPWIDIKNESWLKNAMLYWEEIQTIVPSSIEQPYSTQTAKQFYDEGILKPFHVKSNMNFINDLTEDVLKYLKSPKGTESLMSKEISDVRGLNSHKLSEELSQEIKELVNIHSDKLPSNIRRQIDMIHNDWILVPSRFADFYMTLLATKISDKFGTELLTNNVADDKLATAARLDANTSIERIRNNRIVSRSSLAQGTLANLAIERINVDPNTSVEKILEFRANNSYELGHFRKKVEELTKTISIDQPINALHQQVEDIYINEVDPAVNSLKEELTDSRIKWSIDNYLNVKFFCRNSISIPLALLGLSVPHALLAGAAASLTVTEILYSREKGRILRENPFSYILAAERKFY